MRVPRLSHRVAVVVCALSLGAPAAARAEPGSSPVSAAPIGTAPVIDTVTNVDSDLYAFGVTDGAQVKVLVNGVERVVEPATAPVEPAPTTPGDPAPTTPVVVPPASCGVVVQLVDPDVGSRYEALQDSAPVLPAREAQLGLTYEPDDPQQGFRRAMPKGTPLFGAPRHGFIRVSTPIKAEGCDAAGPTTYRLSLSADRPLSAWAAPLGAEIAEISGPPAGAKPGAALADTTAWQSSGIASLRGTLETVNDEDAVTQEIPSGTAFIVRLEPLTTDVCAGADEDHSPQLLVAAVPVRRSGFTGLGDDDGRPEGYGDFDGSGGLTAPRSATITGIVYTRSVVRVSASEASCAGARYALRIQTVPGHSQPMCGQAAKLGPRIKKWQKDVKTKTKSLARMKKGAKRTEAARRLSRLRKDLKIARRELVVAKIDCKAERKAAKVLKAKPKV